MAENKNLVVSNVLCFTMFYYNKHPIRIVKAMLQDFYTQLVITSAKERLVADVAALNAKNTPRIPSRRINSENKTKLEIEDILALVSFSDENGLLDSLPRYVANATWSQT